MSLSRFIVFNFLKNILILDFAVGIVHKWCPLRNSPTFVIKCMYCIGKSHNDGTLHKSDIIYKRPRFEIHSKKEMKNQWNNTSFIRMRGKCHMKSIPIASTRPWKEIEYKVWDIVRKTRVNINKKIWEKFSLVFLRDVILLVFSDRTKQKEGKSKAEVAS